MKRVVLTMVGVLIAMFAAAHPMLVNRREVAPSSAAATPLPLTGLSWWWVSTDVTNNTVVTTWVDRLQGATWSQTPGITCPTNTSSGMFFNGASNQFLTGSITVVQSG